MWCSGLSLLSASQTIVSPKMLMTQFSQAVVAHKTLLSPTTLCSVLLSSLAMCKGASASACQRFNNWTFSFGLRGRRWGRYRGEQVHQGKGGKMVKERDGEREGSRIHTASVVCAILSLISSRVKVWSGGGGGGWGGLLCTSWWETLTQYNLSLCLYKCVCVWTYLCMFTCLFVWPCIHPHPSHL